EAAAASLAANPTLAGRHARWRPIRAGVSADGTQGFTYGYVQVEGAPPERAHARYLAYWVRRPEGWRIAAYRQVPQQAGAAARDQLPPVLPDRIVTPEPGHIAARQQSLAAAEQAFSDLAQHIGLAAAFTENGTAQSMNMGSPAGFVIGNAAIGRLFPPA